MTQNHPPSEIHIPYPKTSDLHLKINAGLCSLNLMPGFGNVWMTGKYVDPDALAPLGIFTSGKTTYIQLGDIYRDCIQPKDRSQLFLSLGRVRPFALFLTTGDIDHQFDFGCLPLSGLEINGGRGDLVINFSGANPQLMRKMKVSSDGGSIQVMNLANANAAEIRIGGKAASCQLDLSGALQRSTYLHLGMTISNVVMTIPASTAAKITTTHPSGPCQMPGFVYRDHAYWNCPTWDHQQPLLHIRRSIGPGCLRVQST